MKNLAEYLYVIKIFKLLYPYAKLAIGLKIIFAIFKSCIPLVQIYFTKLLIDSINSAVHNAQELPLLLTYLFSTLIVSFINSYLSEYETLLDIKINQKVSFHVDEITLNKITKLPLFFFEEAKNYDVMMRASSNPGGKGIKIITDTINIACNFITLFGLIAILYKFHWVLVISLLLVVMPHSIVALRIGKREYFLNIDQSENNRRSSYFFSLLRSRDTAKELRIFNHSQLLLNKWSFYYNKTISEEYKLSKIKFKSSIFLEIFEVIMNFIFLATLIYVVIFGSYTVGDYVSISQSLSSAMTIVIMISNSFAFIYNQLPYLKDFFCFLDFENDIEDKKEHVFSEHIEIEGLYFKYPRSNNFILEDISLFINRGQKIAIVGENGSGKSTLVKCILGLYRPTKGTIKFDGNNLNNIDVTNSISVVFQDFVKYSVSLKENIVLADLNKHRNHNYSDEDILSYLKLVGGEDIAYKTGGLNGELGVMFSNGNDISGGEWQKVAIARALFKDADIIFFDEPTSALDPIIESKIIELFHEVTKEKTTITVTHRLGSCKYADKIIVMKNGGIVEVGSHEELLKKNNYYAEMYKAQANWYIEGYPVNYYSKGGVI